RTIDAPDRRPGRAVESGPAATDRELGSRVRQGARRAARPRPGRPARGPRRRLPDRIVALLDAGEFPVVLGGDCSILLGAGLAMRRRSSDLDGPIGLVFVDGHSDFRYPGNSSYVGAAAGEVLALVSGRGDPSLTSIDGLKPYFRDIDVVVLGIR